MKVAVMGAGSLGTITGALIAKNGGDVVLVDANREHVQALNKNGATISGMANWNIPVKAVTPDGMEGIYDIVFYMAKQTYNKVALNQLLPHLGPDSVVCTLQNGIPEDAVGEIVGRERTVGGAVSWAAVWAGPGVSMLYTPPEKMEFDIGELDGSVTPRIQRVAEVLSLVCHTIVVDNLMGIRWAKLWMNATLSGMSTVLGCTFGGVIDNPEALKCMAYIGNEAISVARAAGVKIAPIVGRDITTFYFRNKRELHDMQLRYRDLWISLQAQNSKASMLQDLEKGLKTEIDAINGVVCEYGRKTGVATPVNDTVVKIVKGLETGTYKFSSDNLKLFSFPPVLEE